MLLKPALSLLSPSGTRGRLTVLTFHRVLPQRDPLMPDLPDADAFEAQMRWVRDWFNVVPLARGIDDLQAGSICSRALAITFDDGYADNEQIAASILQRLGLPATVFVATGYMDGSCMWNDRVIEAVRRFRGDVLDLQALGLRRYETGTAEARADALRRLLLDMKHFETGRRRDVTEEIVQRAGADARGLMMVPEQVARLPAYGVDVGAHTVTHPILARLDAGAAHSEIADSKDSLEQLLRRPVELFAYPNGIPTRDYLPEHVDMVRRCGFRAAVSTVMAAATRHSDRFQLPRYAPWAGSRLRYGARLFNNLAQRPRVPAAAM